MIQFKKPKKPDWAATRSGLDSKIPLTCEIFKGIITFFFKKIKTFAEKSVQRAGMK